MNQERSKEEMKNSEKSDDSEDEPPRKQRKFPSDDMISPVKQRRKLRRLIISQLNEAREILGAAKPMDKEEAGLEKLIFGCNPEDLEEEEDLEENIKQNDSPKEMKKNIQKKKKEAWVDEYDETVLVKTKAKTLKNCHRSISVRGEEQLTEYLQEKFNKINGAPAWFEIGRTADKDSDEEDNDELLQKTGNFITSSESLPKGIIQIRKCPSLVDTSMKASIVKSVEFHPTSKVALVATTNGIANLFQIDGKINAKIQSICFENFPIETSHFSSDGREIVVGSKFYGHMFSYDMFAGKITRIPEIKGMNQKNMRRFQMSPDGKYIVINGRYGNIHLLTTKSKEWVGTLKMNGEVIAITFNGDGTKMYSHGGNGEVYVWDMNSRKCIHKFEDCGCIDGTAIALSPNEQFLATGSDCGIVNIYDHKTLFSTNSPEPLKVFKNLTTEVSHLRFNSTSELLSMSSARKEEAVKLAHFPSLTVFSNFPARDSISFKYPNTVAFSSNSGYYSIGNNTGRAHIFRLKHYKNY
ncbi:hypothetical protein JTE90_001224 [Oedothorax gibbosus]|uniref:U3 small nucleolar RNA-associated protein 18 homolog n=1 Tax=Oedothorax gibbosus TaxID=931172 RepID=A0AAV6UWK1_9ARAC|nr:hypothetical protein JTE90_001224 [Oedothorax gibbosus]